MKKCPYCAEEIQDEAIVCRFCGRDLPKPSVTNEKVKNKRPRIGLIITIIAVIIVLVASGIGYKLYSGNKITMERTATAGAQYKSNFLNAAVSLINFTSVCNQENDTMSQVWSSAVKGGMDINRQINMHMTSTNYKATAATINGNKGIIDPLMVSLQNPLSGYDDSYKLLLDMYGDYSYLCSQALSPTGSLITHNQGINDKTSDFNTLVDKLMVILPDLKTKISK